MFPFVLFVLGLVLASVLMIPAPRTFTEDEKAAGNVYCAIMLLTTVPVGVYGAWKIFVGPVLWLVGVFRARPELKEAGNVSGWIGLGLLAAAVVWRAIVLPWLHAVAHSRARQ